MEPGERQAIGMRTDAPFGELRRGLLQAMKLASAARGLSTAEETLGDLVSDHPSDDPQACP
jgi:hypothetical protein